MHQRKGTESKLGSYLWVLLILLWVPRIQMIFLFPLSNVGLLTRILMKQIQRNITRHKKGQQCTKTDFLDIPGSLCLHMS